MTNGALKLFGFLIAAAAQAFAVAGRPKNLVDLDTKPLAAFSAARLEKFPSTVPATCRAQWATFASAPLLKNLVRDFQTGTLKIDPSCLAAESALFQSPQLEDLYNPQCPSLPNDRCGIAVWVYRALVIDNLSNSTPVVYTAPIILVHRLVAALFSNFIPRDRVFLHMRSIADELIRREPRLYMAYRIKAFIYLPLLTNPTPPFAEFDTALKTAEAFNAKDAALAEMRFAYHLARQDFSALERSARAATKMFPKSGLGFYYLGLARWVRKDKLGTLAALRRATTLSPGIERFRKTLVAAERAEAGSRGLFLTKVDIQFDEAF